MRTKMQGFIMAHKIKDYDIEKHAWVERLAFSFSHYDSSKYNESEVVVCEHSFEVDVPDDFDPRAGLVANLEAAKQKITAEFQAKVTEINGRIQSLLAIEADSATI